MAKMTMVVGALLAIAGLGFWLAGGRTESAALHPAGLGVLLLLCGVLANSEDARRRMLWMHIAVTLGLIGFLITAIGAGMAMARGASAGSPANLERLIAAAICLIFVLLCVRSFIAARRARLA